MEVRLVEATLDLKDAYLEMVRDFARAGETGRVRLTVTEPAFAEFVAEIRHEGEEDSRQTGHVPQSTFWLLRGDGAILGTARLRHYLTPGLEIWGGHIGYDVRPSERRKGYGTVLLKLTLERARERGLARVLLTCYDENVGSMRVIENNGGHLDGVVSVPEDGRLARRYWIDFDSGAAP